MRRAADQRIPTHARSRPPSTATKMAWKTYPAVLFMTPALGLTCLMRNFFQCAKLLIENID
jgi:hypothetical protein